MPLTLSIDETMASSTNVSSINPVFGSTSFTIGPFRAQPTELRPWVIAANVSSITVGVSIVLPFQRDTGLLFDCPYTRRRRVLRYKYPVGIIYHRGFRVCSPCLLIGP